MTEQDKAWEMHELTQRLLAAQIHLDKIKSGTLAGSIEVAQKRVTEFEERLEALGNLITTKGR